MYCILIKLLIDVVDDNLMKDNDFFVSVVEYIKYSRILCILEILYRLNNLSKCVFMFIVVEVMCFCGRIDIIY